MKKLSRLAGAPTQPVEDEKSNLCSPRYLLSDEFNDGLRNKSSSN